MQTRAGLKIQEVQWRKLNDKKRFEEDLENDFIYTVVVHKKLKNRFPLNLFHRKKEKAILDSVTYKTKKSGTNETKSDESNQNETENKNDGIHSKHHWKTIIKD